MNSPSPQKDFKDWTFDDLVSWAAWRVVNGMIGGLTLKTVMYEVISTVRQWNIPKEPQPKIRKKQSRKKKE